MTRDELRLSFVQSTNAWIAPIFFYDETYALPTKKWLLDTFGPWFFGRWGMYTRRNDCDDFARGYCVFCQESHSETSDNDQAATVGEFCYVRSDGILHAIVVALTDKGWVFIEPQSCGEIYLTNKEKLSCFRVCF